MVHTSFLSPEPGVQLLYPHMPLFNCMWRLHIPLLATASHCSGSGSNSVSCPLQYLAAFSTLVDLGTNLSVIGQTVLVITIPVPLVTVYSSQSFIMYSSHTLDPSGRALCPCIHNARHSVRSSGKTGKDACC